MKVAIPATIGASLVSLLLFIGLSAHNAGAGTLTIKGTTTNAPTPTPTDTHTPVPIPACGLAWRIASASERHVGGSVYRLRALATISDDDIWAVGEEGGRTLTIHWDGVAWQTVASPNNGPLENELHAVSAASA